MKSLSELDPIQYTEYDQNDSVIGDDLDSLAVLKKLLFETSDITAQVSLRSQVQFLINRINLLTSSNNDIINSFLLSKELLAENLKNENNNLNSNETIEKNLKIVNAIYLSTIAKENFNFTGAQKDELEQISRQCPYAGGPGVYKARNMYWLINDNLFYNDADNCAALGYYRMKSEFGEANLNSMIVPNPVRNLARLIYSLPSESNGRCYIYDNIGNVVEVIELLPNIISKEFSTEMFGPGIYHYRIFSNNSSIANGKFAVIR